MQNKQQNSQTRANNDDKNSNTKKNKKTNTTRRNTSTLWPSSAQFPAPTDALVALGPGYLKAKTEKLDPGLPAL